MESIRHDSFKAYKFFKTGVHGKYILASSGAKCTRLLYLKLMFYFDFILSNCPSDIVHYFLTSPTLYRSSCSVKTRIKEYTKGCQNVKRVLILQTNYCNSTKIHIRKNRFYRRYI